MLFVIVASMCYITHGAVINISRLKKKTRPMGFGYDSTSGLPPLHDKHLIYSNTNPLNIKSLK